MCCVGESVMKTVEQLAAKLGIASVKNFQNPYSSITWEENLDKNQLFYSPELMSLSPLGMFNKLSSEQINKLSFYETINFFSINIHGERELISGMSLKLYKDYPANVTDYLHHFIDEENKHMLWFGTFCEKYAGKTYKDKKIFFPREYLEGEEELLFFSKIVIFEELVDSFNKAMAKDERLHPLVRQIHRQHHIDESRHLSFGRELVKEIYHQYFANSSAEIQERIGSYLGHYLMATWREYYNPEVYIDAGLENPFDLVELAWKDPACIQFRESISEKVIKFFMDHQIMLTRPELV
jgi:hypothetical protein